MSTVNDLIHSSMRLIGSIAAGETMETNELNDALVSLNQMISSWNTEGASLVGRQALEIPVTGRNSYTLPVWPIQIVAASVLQQNQDSPLELVDAAGWESITEKEQASVFCQKLYCDYLYPTSTVFLWPIPRFAGILEILVLSPIAPFISLTDTINLPQGYEAGLRFALAVLLAPEYGRPLDQAVVAQAQNFKASLAQLNAGNQMKSQVSRTPSAVA